MKIRNSNPLLILFKKITKVLLLVATIALLVACESPGEDSQKENIETESVAQNESELEEYSNTNNEVSSENNEIVEIVETTETVEEQETKFELCTDTAAIERMLTKVVSPIICAAKENNYVTFDFIDNPQNVNDDVIYACLNYVAMTNEDDIFENQDGYYSVTYPRAEVYSYSIFNNQNVLDREIPEYIGVKTEDAIKLRWGEGYPYEYRINDIQIGEDSIMVFFDVYFIAWEMEGEPEIPVGRYGAQLVPNENEFARDLGIEYALKALGTVE